MLVENMARAPSTAGYAETADELAVRYESITFVDIYGDLVRFVPKPPARVLDIGAGTGRDAAALAALGHSVVAVEPTAEMRRHGQRLHADVPITWVDGMLPDLAALDGYGRFDLILMTAVWMHLDEEERRRAFPRLASLLADGGRLLMSVRHGPVPAGRRMFEVPTAEIVEQARRHGLSLLATADRDAIFSSDEVTWTLLAFGR